MLYATETSSSVLVGSGEDGPSAALSSNLASLSRDIAFQLTVFSRQRVRPISNPEVSMATICFDTTLRTVAGDDAVELCGTWYLIKTLQMTVKIDCQPRDKRWNTFAERRHS